VRTQQPPSNLWHNIFQSWCKKHSIAFRASGDMLPPKMSCPQTDSLQKLLRSITRVLTSIGLCASSGVTVIWWYNCMLCAQVLSLGRGASVQVELFVSQSRQQQSITLKAQHEWHSLCILEANDIPLRILHNHHLSDHLTTDLEMSNPQTGSGGFWQLGEYHND